MSDYVWFGLTNNFLGSFCQQLLFILRSYSKYLHKTKQTKQISKQKMFPHTISLSLFHSLCRLPFRSFSASELGNVFMTAVTLRHKIGFPTEPIHNFSH